MLVRFRMKFHSFSSNLAICLLGVGVLLGSNTEAVTAGNNPLISVNETGSGSLGFPGSPAFNLTGVLAPDPGPGGRSSALTYNLLGPPGLVAGDVFMNEPGESTSDLIRFNPSGTGGNQSYAASLVFYSLAGEGAPADTGLPSLFYENRAFVLENPSGVATYTPTSSQPGFVPGFEVSYVFTSAISAPDSGAAALFLSLGFGGLVLLQRVPRLRKQA